MVGQASFDDVEAERTAGFQFRKTGTDGTHRHPHDCGAAFRTAVQLRGIFNKEFITIPLPSSSIHHSSLILPGFPLILPGMLPRWMGSRLRGHIANLLPPSIRIHQDPSGSRWLFFRRRLSKDSPRSPRILSRVLEHSKRVIQDRCSLRISGGILSRFENRRQAFSHFHQDRSRISIRFIDWILAILLHSPSLSQPQEPFRILSKKKKRRNPSTPKDKTHKKMPRNPNRSIREPVDRDPYLGSISLPRIAHDSKHRQTSQSKATEEGGGGANSRNSNNSSNSSNNSNNSNNPSRTDTQMGGLEKGEGVTYRLHFSDDVAAGVEGLREGSCCHEGTLHLHGKLLGDVAERFQFLHVGVDTYQVSVNVHNYKRCIHYLIFIFSLHTHTHTHTEGDVTFITKNKCPLIYLSIYLFIYLSIYLFIYLQFDRLGFGIIFPAGGRGEFQARVYFYLFF